MVGLGLLPLVALARMLGVEDDRALLLPAPYALLVALAIGVAACAIVGRATGLLVTRVIGTYEDRYRLEVRGAATAARRHGRTTRRRG